MGLANKKNKNKLIYLIKYIPTLKFIPKLRDQIPNFGYEFRFR